MKDLAQIYALWETMQVMADEIGVPGVTVRQWRRRGFIPPVYWAAIIEAASQRGAQLSHSDFPKDKNLSAFASFFECAA